MRYFWPAVAVTMLAAGCSRTDNEPGPGGVTVSEAKALDDAAQAMKDSDAAMKKGDWSAYGDAQKQLQEALNKAIELEQ